MFGDFGRLALLACASPLTDVLVDASPDEAGGHQLLRGTHTWVREDIPVLGWHIGTYVLVEGSAYSAMLVPG